MANKGAIAASIVGGLVALGAIVYFLAPGIITGIIPIPNRVEETDNDMIIASPSVPRMQLLLLESADDNAPVVARYDANNTEPIELASNAHIKFDSADYRTAEGMTITARNLNTGEIELLRKSYDVNNQFFVNLDNGSYDIQVQAKWAEKGTFSYKFDVLVV